MPLPGAVRGNAPTLMVFRTKLLPSLGSGKDHLADASGWATSVDLSPRTIRSACATFPKKTAIGVDNSTFPSISELPDCALLALGALMRECISHLALLVQVLFQLLALLGKGNGGSRTITILSTSYRLLMRILSVYITAWTLHFVGPRPSGLTLREPLTSN